tara:strand:+ start:241 stop:948 length:708 start_codon:yes stop_codon:yes gene_type:complete
MKYKRILLKLSGEALMGEKDFGIDVKVLNYYAQEIKSILSLGIELAIVIGGGNIFRGVQVEEKGLNRVQGDYMGMLATMINGMALQSSLEKNKIDTRLLSAIKMEQIAESFIRRRAMRHLDKGRVVIFGSGTGNPFFSTDTAAALRAIEVGADLILKGTNVDGVFSEDPKINQNAELYTKISYSEVIRKKLKVMDMTAFTMCEENKIPIIVCNINNKGNLSKILNGDQIGTLINF